jgi:hypothetical protein
VAFKSVAKSVNVGSIWTVNAAFEALKEGSSLIGMEAISSVVKSWLEVDCAFYN